MQDHLFQTTPTSFDIFFEETFRERGHSFVIWPNTSTIDHPDGRLESTIKYLHYHDDLQLGVCYQGSGKFIVDNHVIEFHAPCAAIIYPGQIHAAQSNPKDPSFWYIVHVDSRECGGHSMLSSAAPVFDRLSQTHADIMTLISIMIRTIQDSDGHDESTALGLLNIILQKHRQISDGQSAEDSHVMFNDIAPAIVYITSHYQETCPVQQLAELCNMSAPTLRRKFVHSVDYSPNDYLHRIRIKNAVSLLSNPNLSILDISAMVGYQSISSFNRQFLKIMRQTPNEVRKRQSAQTHSDD